MTLQQLLLIVWAWRKLVLILLAATVLITLVVSLVMPKQYTATTSIYVDVKSDPILGGVLPGMMSPSYMATQSEIIQSSRVAGRVVKLLRIADVPSVFQSWKEDTGGKISIEEYYGALLLKALAVQPGRGSNIINLSFTSSDPHFAASVANAFAQATLETNIELRVDPAREYAAWFDERLKVLRDNLEKAQTKLSVYQQQNGIVATAERLDQEMSRLDSLNGALSASETEKADVDSRDRNTGNELSPDVIHNGLVQNLKSDIAQSETKLSEISGYVGEKHPQRQQLEAHIAELKAQLAREITRVSGGVATANRVTTQKQTELRAAVELQKKRVLDLRAQNDQINILRQDVESARHAYELVAQRMSQTTLESHSQQASMSVLSPAAEPTSASKPRILVNVFASVLIGLMLGFGAALGREFMDRRVRHRDDLLAMQGIPFLGSVRPKHPYQFLTGRLAAVVAWVVRRFRRRTPALVA